MKPVDTPSPRTRRRAADGAAGDPGHLRAAGRAPAARVDAEDRLPGAAQRARRGQRLARRGPGRRRRGPRHPRTPTRPRACSTCSGPTRAPSSSRPAGEAPAAGKPTDVEPLLAGAEAQLVEWREIEAVVPSLDAWVSLHARARRRGDHRRRRHVAAGRHRSAAGSASGELGRVVGLPEVPVSRLVRDLVSSVSAPSPTVPPFRRRGDRVSPPTTRRGRRSSRRRRHSPFTSAEPAFAVDHGRRPPSPTWPGHRWRSAHAGPAATEGGGRRDRPPARHAQPAGGGGRQGRGRGRDRRASAMRPSRRSTTTTSDQPRSAPEVPEHRQVTVDRAGTRGRRRAGALSLDSEYSDS